MQKWQTVPKFPDYEASSSGKIRRATPASGTWPGRILTPKIDKDGYQVVAVSSRKKTHHVGVHRLVAMAFHGLPPRGKTQVNHDNGKKKDNRPGNLFWATPSENQQHASRHGLFRDCRGTCNGNSTLTPTKVRKIRRLAKAKITQKEIASLVGASPNAVHFVLKGKTWAWLK